MTTFSIDELIAPATEAQTLERFLVNLETLGLKPRDWRSGGVARSILRAVAKTYAGYTTVMAEFVRGGFLELATGVWLTRTAKYVYGVDRRPATFATGFVTLTNAGSSHGPFAADTQVVKWTSGNKSYRITEAFSLSPSEVKTVAIKAVEAGSSSSAPATQISAFETPLIGVTVSNASPVVGNDEESDPELRQRCLDKLSALSLRGPRGAYRYAVTSATRTDGSPVDINRFAISPSSSTGVVTVYCASPSGVPVTTDLDFVKDSIEKWARPDSVTVNVLAATSVTVTRSITVYATYTEGVSATDIKALVEAAITPISKTYPIGGIVKPATTQGYLWANYVEGVIKAAHASIFDVTGWGADVALAAGQVATLSVTVDVRIAEPS